MAAGRDDLTLFTAEQIDASLEEASKDPLYEVKVSYSETGSDLNTFKYVKQFASKRKNVFRHTQPVALGSNKKKVLYCASAEPRLERVEIAYYASLIKHRAAFLRVPIAGGKFRIKGPYRSLDVFLKDRRTAQASRIEVLRTLGDEHKSADSFVILDQDEYPKALKRLGAMPNLGALPKVEGRYYQSRWISDRDLQFLKGKSPTSLDLCFIPTAKFHEMAALIKKDQLKKVKLMFPRIHDIEELLSLFPDLETIEIVGVNQEWIQRCLHLFPAKMNVILEGYQDTTLKLPVAVKFHQLTVKNPKDALNFSAQPGASLHSLEFEMRDKDLSCNVHGLETLEVLSVNDCGHSRCHFIFPQENNIRLLKMRNCRNYILDEDRIRAIDFRLLPQLREFIFKDSSLSQLANLFSPEETSCFSCRPARPVHPNLETIELDDPSELNLNRFRSDKDIELSRYARATPVKKIWLNADRFPNGRALRKLLQRYTNVESIDIEYANQDWIEQCLPIIPQHVSVTLRNFICTRKLQPLLEPGKPAEIKRELVLPRGLNLNKLKIYDSTVEIMVLPKSEGDAAADIRVKQLEIEYCSKLEDCDLSGMRDLDVLAFDFCRSKVIQLIGSPATLIARYCNYIACPPVFLFKQLKTLVLHESGCSLLDDVDKSLVLHESGCSLLDDIDKSQVLDSKERKMMVDEKGLYSEQVLEHIELKDIPKPSKPDSPPPVPHYDFSLFPQLKKATLGKDIVATLPEGVAGEPLTVPASVLPSQNSSLVFDCPAAFEAWSITGERQTDYDASDISRDVYFRKKATNKPGPFRPEAKAVIVTAANGVSAEAKRIAVPVADAVSAEAKIIADRVADVTLAKELETLAIGDSWDWSRLNAAQLAQLKKVKIHINRTNPQSPAPVVDLSNCPQLREVELCVTNSHHPVELKLNGCRELQTLEVDTDQDPVNIQGLDDCSELRYTKITATNAATYRDRFPAESFTHFLNTEPRPIPQQEDNAPQLRQDSGPNLAVAVAAVGSILFIGGVTIAAAVHDYSVAHPNTPILPELPSFGDIVSGIWHGITTAASAIWNFISSVPGYLHTAINAVWSVLQTDVSMIWSYLQAAPDWIYSGITHFIVAHPVLIACTAVCILAYVAYRFNPEFFNRWGERIESAINSLWSEDQPIAPAEVKVEQEVKPEVKPEEPELPDPDRIELRPDELLRRKKESYDRFYRALIAKTIKKPLRSLVTDILEAEHKESFAPLIELKAGQNPMAVDGHIIRQLAESKKYDPIRDHLYVHSPDDFLEYYKPGKLDQHDQIVAEEKGPLKEFFTDTVNKKVLVVNLDLFSPKQRAGFQSILDKPRPYITVGDEENSETIEIPENVQVILMSTDIAGLGEAFRSRCTPWVLHEEFTQSHKRQLPDSKRGDEQRVRSLEEDDPVDAENKAIEGIAVDAHYNPAWEDAVGLEMIFAGQGVTFSPESPFWKAWNEGRPLIVHNAPNDEGFKRFVHRVNVEKKIDLFTGRLTPVPKGFCIQVKTKTRPSLLKLSNVHVYCRPVDEEKFGRHKREYLGIQDLHRCYRETCVDAKGNAVTTVGLLESYDPNTHVFYLIGAIKQCYWEKLIAEIKKKYPAKEFHFILTPGASIENVARREGLPIQIEKRASDEAKLSASGLSVGSNLGLALESKIVGKANVYVSNDPSYLAETLAKEQDGLVIDVHPNMSFGDLMAEMECKAGGGFQYSKRGVLTELTTGRTKARGFLAPETVGQAIVLNGELSPATYFQLLSFIARSQQLADTPEVKCNGETIKITGRLMLVMPEHVKEQLSGVLVEERHYDWPDYHRILDGMDARNAELLNKIQRFYELADKLPHQGDGRPDKPYRSYYRLVRMLDALKQMNPLHQLNPIKDIFLYDYPKDKNNYDDMVDYAYLNVMGKYLFKREQEDKADATVVAAKLNKFKKLFNIQSIADIEKNAWHLLNCFDATVLDDILGNPLENALSFRGFPCLKPNALKRLESAFHQHSKEEQLQLGDGLKEAKGANPPKKQQRHVKQQLHLAQLLKDKKNNPLIILKGSPGAGKTHSIRQELGGIDKYYEGEEGFITWLEKGDRPFLWDEINMASEQELVILGALRRGDKRIRYFNKAKGIDRIYTLKENQEPVIGTCNPENFGGGRDFSDILQDVGVTIYYEEPSDEFYVDDILNPRLGAEYEKYSHHMLYAFHHVRKYNPFIPRSTRDLKSLARRFLHLLNKVDRPSEAQCRQILLQACEVEFAGSIKDVSDRKKFIQELRAHFAVVAQPEEKKDVHPMIHLTDEVSVPYSNKYLVDAIEQFLWMRLETLINRAKQIKQKGAFSEAKIAALEVQTQMVIVEGDPGVGKSTDIRAIIEKHQKELGDRAQALRLRLSVCSEEDKPTLQVELEVINLELAKKVQVISSGSANANTMLVKVQESEGMAVVDENVEDMEKVTNQLLGNVDEKRRPVDKRGLAIFRSQNASSEVGRPSASPAELNRTVFLCKDAYTDMDIEAFVADKKLDDPEEYSRAYNNARKLHPEINPRTFHVILKEVALEVRKEKEAAAEAVRAERARRVPAGVMSRGLLAGFGTQHRSARPAPLLSTARAIEVC